MSWTTFWRRLRRTPEPVPEPPELGEVHGPEEYFRALLMINPEDFPDKIKLWQVRRWARQLGYGFQASVFVPHGSAYVMLNPRVFGMFEREPEPIREPVALTDWDQHTRAMRMREHIIMASGLDLTRSNKVPFVRLTDLS